MTETGIAVSPEPRPVTNRLPVPGWPPCTVMVAVVEPAGTMTSGMMTDFGMSVLTSISRPPSGAGVPREKVIVARPPVVRLIERGE